MSIEYFSSISHISVKLSTVRVRQGRQMVRLKLSEAWSREFKGHPTHIRVLPAWPNRAMNQTVLKPIRKTGNGGMLRAHFSIPGTSSEHLKMIHPKEWGIESISWCSMQKMLYKNNSNRCATSGPSLINRRLGFCYIFLTKHSHSRLRVAVHESNILHRIFDK